MNMFDLHSINQLGMAIFHSLWQIGVVVFIYFFLLLTIRKRNIKQRYVGGLICLAIIFLSFTLTLLSHNYQSEPTIVNANNSISEVSVENLQINNLLEQELVKPSSIAENFKTIFLKIETILNSIAGTIGIVWLLCIIFLAIRKLNAFQTLKKIRNSKHNLRSNKWQVILAEISTSLNLKKRVDILFSPFVNSPISFGLIKPVILFPLRLTTGLSNKEIECILIHELAHNLRNDYLLNVFQNVMEVLFFYHPGVWWMSRKIRTQREILCDEIVTSTSISKQFYINTLLKLGELRLSDSNLAVAAKRSNNELLTRIMHMLSKPDVSKNRSSVVVTAALVLLFIVSGFTYKVKKDFLNSPDLKETVENRLAPYQGSIVIYDSKQNKYYTFNDSVSDIRYPTYSTFKVASSLIAFDMGIAKNEFYTIKYDSLKHPLPDWMKKSAFFKNWYKDQTIKSALNYSVNWYFKELGTLIGYDNMNTYLNKLDYGNKVISPGDEPSWYNGQLKISANEQVEFIKNILNQDCKDISVKAQNLTKEILPLEKGDDFSLYSKTGTGEISDTSYIGWLVGYVKTKENSYAFAINMFANDDQKISGETRRQMVKDIFDDLGLISN